jgi:uracil-DNA glycosylase
MPDQAVANDPGGVRLHPSWRRWLDAEFQLPYMQALRAFLAEEKRRRKVIYPRGASIFAALDSTPFEQVRVVIIGQDPYHGPGQAQGLAFSVPEGVRVPPSLRNIFAEVSRDLGCAPPPQGNLSRWARQGVLLLNTVLTVEQGQPASHAKRGWETLTDRLIGMLAADAAPKVFLLWGAPAQARRALIAQAAPSADRHGVLAANHPSPLSARRPPVPFIGCGHFSAANAFLQARGRGCIDWCGPS